MSQKYPRNVADFVCSQWAGKIKHVISKFNLNEPVEDTFQDVLLVFLEKDYLNKWEEGRCAYSNWVITLVRNLCLTKSKRSHSVPGKAIENAYSIVTSIDEDTFEIGVQSEEQLVGETNIGDFNLLVEEIERALQKFKPNSYNNYKGYKIARDPITVFRLLKLDYSVREIAEIMGTSYQFVHSLKNKICDTLIAEGIA